MNEIDPAVANLARVSAILRRAATCGNCTGTGITPEGYSCQNCEGGLKPFFIVKLNQVKGYL